MKNVDNHHEKQKTKNENSYAERNMKIIMKRNLSRIKMGRSSDEHVLPDGYNRIGVVSKAEGMEMPFMPKPGSNTAVVIVPKITKLLDQCSIIIFDELEKFNAYVPKENQKVVFYQSSDEDEDAFLCIQPGKRYSSTASNIGYTLAAIIEENVLAKSDELCVPLLEEMRRTKNWGMVSEHFITHPFEDDTVVFEAPVTDFFVFNNVRGIIVKTRELLECPVLAKTGKPLIFWKKKTTPKVSVKKLGEGKYIIVADFLGQLLAILSNEVHMQLVDKLYEKTEELNALKKKMKEAKSNPEQR